MAETHKMPDSEKAALSVSAAVAVIALLYYWNRRNQVTTDSSGNIVYPTGDFGGGAPNGGSVSPGPTINLTNSAPGGPTLTPNPNPINVLTGTNSCGCGCTQGPGSAQNTVEQITAAYGRYLQTAEGNLITQITNNFVADAYPGSLNVGENGNNFELQYT